MRKKIDSNVFLAGIYIRLSREDGDKAESDSIVNQRDLLTRFVNNNSDIILFNEYIDDGWSGTNFERPAFIQMRRDIEDGKINCVIVKDLSRLGRDYLETGTYIEKYFPNHNVRFIAINDNIDSEKNMDFDIIMPVKNIFNEQYARDISKKVKSSIATRQKKGDFIGAFASYGYKKDPLNKHRLLIDDYAAGIIRRIFEMFVEGKGKIAIAKILNEEGILPPTEYKRLTNLNYQNGNKMATTTYWTYSTIHKILKNELYIGNMVQGKDNKSRYRRSRSTSVNQSQWIKVPGTHTPIISQEIWDKAQALLKVRTRQIDFKENVSIFAGFLKCKDCGRAMVKTYDHDNIYYVCGSYRRYGIHVCSHHRINHTIIEKIVLDDLNSIVEKIENLHSMIEEIQNENQLTDKNNKESNVERIKIEIEKINTNKKTLYHDLKEGLIDKNEYLQYKKEYNDKIVFLEQQVSSYQQEGKAKKEKFSPFDLPKIQQLLKYRKIKNLTRNMVVEMIDHIEIGENKNIDIFYTFENDLELVFNTCGLSS